MANSQPRNRTLEQEAQAASPLLVSACNLRRKAGAGRILHPVYKGSSVRSARPTPLPANPASSSVSNSANSATLAGTRYSRISRTAASANPSTSTSATSPKGHPAMGKHQHLRICVDLDATRRMSTTTRSTRSCSPEPRANTRGISQPPGAGSTGAPCPPSSSLEGQGKDARPNGPRSPQRLTTAEIIDRLDTSGPQRVDRRPQLTNTATVQRNDSAIDPQFQPRWDPERKSDPCPPYPRPDPESVPPGVGGHRQSAGRARRRQQPDSANMLGRR